VCTAPCDHVVCCAPCLALLLQDAPLERRRCPVCRAPVRAARSVEPPFAEIALPTLPPDPRQRPRGAPAIQEASSLERHRPSTQMRGSSGASQLPGCGSVQSGVRSMSRGERPPQQRSHRRQSALLATQSPLARPQDVLLLRSHQRQNLQQHRQRQPQSAPPALRRGRSIMSDPGMSSAARVRATWPALVADLPTVLVIGHSARLLHAFLTRLRDAVPSNLSGSRQGSAIFSSFRACSSYPY
jgi:hypothetical protein